MTTESTLISKEMIDSMKFHISKLLDIQEAQEKEKQVGDQKGLSLKELGKDICRLGLSIQSYERELIITAKNCIGVYNERDF